jgi:hypothetical protein
MTMFSQKPPTSFDFYRELVKTRQGVEWNNLLLGGISDSLFSIHAEIAQVRQMNAEALAIQQELLNREIIQSKLEEFIFQMEKMVNEFNQPGDSPVPSTRYFLLTGVLKTIREQGISTAIVRGRDNKAAFDKCANEAMSLLKRLHDEPEVKAALAWAKEEQKRLEDQRQKQEEERKKQAEEKVKRQREEEEERERRKREREAEEEENKREREARIAPLRKKIAMLEASKQKLGFSSWYKEVFKDKNLVIQILLWGFAGGWCWIPIWYWFAASDYDQKMNPQANEEIKGLQQQIRSIEAEAS